MTSRLSPLWSGLPRLSNKDWKLEETKPTISLHGLGFLQIKLDSNAKQRLHVWHPDLPRRRCFEQSQIHDHRFGFTSRVLVGGILNDTYGGFNLPADHPDATHIAYWHEGPRSEHGNRPWHEGGPIMAGCIAQEIVQAGESYHMLPYVFHTSRPMGDRCAVTLMTVTKDRGPTGARSLCEVNVVPDMDFDRFQLSTDTMWGIFQEALVP